jgi:hypothetical protein
VNSIRFEGLVLKKHQIFARKLKLSVDEENSQ